MITLGEMQLIPLFDGRFRLDGGAMFGVIPKTLWQRRAPADDENRIALTLRPLLIRTPEKNVLIDAGVGSKLTPKELEIYAIDRSETLDASLRQVGLECDDVDVVIATHLHFDHVGGLTRWHEDRIRPTFRRARHYVRRGEWADANHPHERSRASYMGVDFLPLADAGLIDWIEDDGEILPGVSVRRTGGHTSHHQIVLIESGGHTAVFVADLLPTVAHIDAPWIMGYDLFPMDTLAYKRRFVAEAIEREYVIFFEHDPDVAAGIIRQDEGRRFVEPILR
jgi:glyoxylase-like metal-dependent hydrolase (beta-lactamase superfamily II)